MKLLLSRHKLHISFFAFMVGLHTQAKAPDYSIHQDYTSTRALGMGNAFIAVADDFNALFYNPAALALRKNSQFHGFVRAGIDGEYPDFIDKVENADKAPDPTQATADVIAEYYGKHLYSRVPTVGGVWVRPRWGIGFIPADLSIDLAMNQLLGPSVAVNAYLDTTLAYGYGRFVNWGKLKNQLAVGGTIKAIHRAYFSDVVNAGTLAVDSEVFDPKKAAEGMTVDMDIGFMYVPTIKNAFVKKYMKPTFAAVIRNAVDYGFPMQFRVFNKNNPPEPAKLQRRFDLGTKLELCKFWVFDPKLAIDIRDMGHDNWTFKKGAHAGMEFYWTMYNWWKGHWSAGLNQGYWTAGFGARLGVFQLDLASWGEEVGTRDLPLESRRYIAEIAIDI
jgi:hypothetical protein